MKPILAVFFGIALFIVACKKEKPEPEEQPTASYSAWDLNKTWQMWGYQSTYYHPSSGAPVPPYYNTITNSAMAMTTLNDTTVVFKVKNFSNNVAFDTLSLYATNTQDGYAEYIPKVFKNTGTRYLPTFLKHYYVKDSLWYFYVDYGVSFHDTVELYTQ